MLLSRAQGASDQHKAARAGASGEINPAPGGRASSIHAGRGFFLDSL